MFNYIKWELKDTFKSRYKWLILAAVIYLLTVIIPLEDKDNNYFQDLILLGFFITISVALFGTFFKGTKTVIDSFDKKTFLLESMIPLPPKKILLAKYILAIILNTIYFIIFYLGILVIVFKSSGFQGIIKSLDNLIKNFEIITFIEGSFNLFLLSITFMSLAILCFVIAKVLNPNSKSSKFIGIIIAVISLYTIIFVLSLIWSSSNCNIYVSDLLYLTISVCSYFFTSYLIEKKLEIYT
jgi:ABC-type transport system involved in multi-copper enzyme maturation permease subunit